MLGARSRRGKALPLTAAAESVTGDGHIQPRLLSGTDAAAYCGVTLNTWSKWVAAGTMPPPVLGTRRWDKKAIDLILDKASAINGLGVRDGRV